MLKYQMLAMAFQARNNCIKSGNEVWKENHEEKIESIINSLPHGSGIDGTTLFNFDSTENKLIINSEYHYMDENGFYDGWIPFQIILTPSWTSFNCEIKGKFLKKHFGIKDYLEELIYDDLSKAWD